MGSDLRAKPHSIVMNQDSTKLPFVALGSEVASAASANQGEEDDELIGAEEILSEEGEEGVEEEAYDDSPQVLHSVLSNFLQYEHDDGSTLSLADILLLIKQSIDRNTEVQSRVLETLLASREPRGDSKLKK